MSVSTPYAVVRSLGGDRRTSTRTKPAEALRRSTSAGEKATLELFAINTLPQMRPAIPAINDIDVLAASIIKSGLQQEPGVEWYNAQEARNYLRVINELHGCNLALDDLKSSRRPGFDQAGYAILIYGHRRLDALKLIWERGDLVSLDMQGPLEPPGACYRRLFGGALVDVTVYKDLPEEAVDRQLVENTYKPVPLPDESSIYYRLWRVRRMMNPTYSLGQFAKDVGRKEDAVRDRLSFGELPFDIQDAVRAGKTSFGVGVELGRLQQWLEGSWMPLPQRLYNFDYFVKLAVTRDFGPKEFGKMITQFIKDNKVQQMELLDLMQEALSRQLHQRQSAFGHAGRVITDATKLFEAWNFYLGSDRFRPEDAPLVSPSIRAQLAAFLRLCEALSDQAEMLLSPELRRKVRNEARRVNRQLEKLNRAYPKDPLPDRVP